MILSKYKMSPKIDINQLFDATTIFSLISMCMQWITEGPDHHLILLDELVHLGFDPIDLGGSIP